MRNALIIVGIGAVILAGGGLVPHFYKKWGMAHVNEEVVTDIEHSEATTTAASTQRAADMPGAAIGSENLVTFKCDGGKSIVAVFERDIVALALSDGRQVTLRQAASGSGIRYLSNDAKIEFRGKGSEGFLIENGTNLNCVAGQ